jgi:phosphoglucosamine mutase
MSNSGLDEAMLSAGARVVRTGVGDRYVVEEMVKGGYNLGGEQSGHIIFLDHTTTGDGIITALQVVKAMVKEGRPLSELARCMKSFPQVLRNVKVREKKNLDDIPGLQAALKSIEEKLKGCGRAFIRYSGTEALVRITIEGEDEVEIKAMSEELADILIKELGEH